MTIGFGWPHPDARPAQERAGKRTRVRERAVSVKLPQNVGNRASSRERSPTGVLDKLGLHPEKAARRLLFLLR